MSAARVTIDVRPFNRMCRDLARVGALDQAKAVEYEVGKVLEATMRNTPAANVAKIRASSEKQRATQGDFGKGRKIYFLDNRYPDALWAKIVTARKISLQKKLKARGLSKRSWHAIAALLGIAISVPAFVAKAVARTGKTYPEDATAVRRSTRAQFGIFIANSNPILQFLGGAGPLRRAINGRVKYFYDNVRRGVFRSIANIAKRYPGVKVSI